MNAEAFNTINQLKKEVKRLNDKILDLENSVGNNRLAAEKEIKKSEKRYNDIISGLVWAIAIHVNNRIVYINDAVKELVGIEDEENIIGRNVLEFIHPEDQEKVVNAIQSVYTDPSSISGNTSKVIEERLIRNDGTVRIVETSAILIDYAGESAIVVTLNDITDRKLAEKRLKESEAKYRAIFEEAKEGLIVVDENSLIREINPTFSKITGLQEEEVIGKSGYDIAKKYESIKQLPQLLDAIKNMLLDRPIQSYQISYKDKFFELSTNIQENGEVIGIIHDTTERKLAEEKVLDTIEIFSTAEKIAKMGSWSWSPNTNKVEWSDNMCRLFGEDPFEFIPTLEYASRSIYPDDVNFVNELIERLLTSKKPQPSSEFRILTLEKELIWIEVTTRILLDQKGEIREVVGTIQDITKSKKTLENLRYNEEQLEILFNGITDGFALCEMIFDERGKPVDYLFLRINPAFELQAGMEVSSTIGKTIKEIYPDIEQEWIDRYGSVVLHHKPIHFIDYNHNTKKHYSVKAFPTTLNEFAMLFEDITNKKNTEEKLKVSEKKYKLLFDSMTEFFQVIELVYDKDGKATDYFYRQVNPAFENFVGKSKEELIDKRAKDIFGVVEDHWIEVYENVNKTGLPITYENYGEELDKFYNIKAWKVSKNKIGIIFSDITERKKQQKALKTSEYSLRKSQEIANLGSYTLDITQGFWESSPILDEIFGIEKQDEKTFDSWSQLLHPDDREMMMQYFTTDVLIKHQTFDKEYRIQRKNDNQERWVHGMGNLEFDEDGALIIMHGTIQDITARKQSEKALRESEQKFRDLTNLLPLIVYEIDMTGKLIYLNNQGFKTFGYTEEDFERGLNVLESIVPEDRERAKNSIQNRLQTMEDGGVEYTAQRKDRTRFPVMIYASVILTDNKASGLRGVIMDHTLRKEAEEALKKSEQQYRDFFEKDISGSFLSSPEGKLINCNPAFSKMLGYTSEEIMEIETVQFYPNPSVRNEFIDQLIKNKNLLNFEIDLVKKDGRLINCVENVVGVYNSKGELIQFQGYIVDITDRKIAEKAVRESEEKYRSLFATANDAIFVMKNDIFIACNQKTLEIFGCMEDEIIGYSPTMFSPDFQPDGMISKEKAAIKIKDALSGVPQFFEWTHRRKNGTPFAAEVSLNRMLLSDGEYIHAIVRNIDERKLAERALKENEARLSTLISNLPGMTYLGIDDEKWTMLYLNGACEKLTGYRPEQIINNKDISFLEIIHPEDRQYVRDQINPEIKIGKHFELEYRIITAKGETKWVWERGIHRTSRDGTVLLTEGVIDDMTERVLAKHKLIESEEKYHGMIMNLMEGFYRATVDGKLTEYNTEFIKILGLDPGNDYLGLELPDFWEDRSQRKKYIREFLKHGYVKNYIVDIRRSDGTLAIVQINSRLIKDESGEKSRTEGTLLDITDRVRAEESLKQSENQLRNLTAYMDIKTENEKKIIAGEIHDGIGQLLTGLKMDLQWINKKHPKESNVLKRKLTSMNNIIDSAVTDIQKLSIQLRPKMLDDLGLLETLQSETIHFEERTGISCTIHFLPKTFEVEYNKSSAIYRIMMELLTNVFRHANASKVEIKLEKEKNKYVFTVIDNGIGISLKQINSRSSFGLMSITERVKVWSGYVKIRGVNNKGTTVEVTIPN